MFKVVFKSNIVVGVLRVYSEVLSCYVEIPEHPSRIVSLTPSITETLFLLGVGDRIVGVSRFCFKPEEALSKVKVGDYVKVDYRILKSLKPDLILCSTGVQLELVRELYSRGYPVYPIPLPTTVHDIISLVVSVGRLVGRDVEAYELASKLNLKLSSLKFRKRVRGYYEVDLGGPITVGKFSYITNSLYLLGVDHVYSNVSKTYFEPDYEFLSRIQSLEVVIYECAPGRLRGKSEVLSLMESRGLERLKAIVEGRVLVLEPNTLTHYGPSHIVELCKVSKRLREMLKA